MKFSPRTLRAWSATLGTAVALSLGTLVLLPAPTVAAEPSGTSAVEGTVPDPTSTGGRRYNVSITSLDSGDPIAFTVFEPAVIAPDETYPLVLQGHGFGGTRSQTPSGAVPFGIEGSLGTVVGDVRKLITAGFWVASFDQRGHGQSGGSVRFMDPDHEGKDLIQMVDWLEANLPKLAYRDGNLVLGSTGGSYGGGYQNLLLAIDPEKRLDAIVPQITWYDLNESLTPGGVFQSAYTLALGGLGALTTQGRISPYFISEIAKSMITNSTSPEFRKLLRYHSPAYWCDGQSLPGTTDEGIPYRPATALPKVDALVVQGMSDVFFNPNEGFDLFRCLQRGGGDVRFTSYQFGHTFPNGINLASPPAFGFGCSLVDLCPEALKNLPLSPSGLVDAAFSCGGVGEPDLEVTWLRAKLRQDGDAIAALTTTPQECIALDSLGDSVDISGVNKPLTSTAIPGSKLVFNGLQAFPTIAPLTTIKKSTVVAGTPTATITLKAALPDPGIKVPAIGIDDPIVYVALGRSRGSLSAVCKAGLAGLPVAGLCQLASLLPGALPGTLEVIDQQVTPIRGLGTHTINLHGIGERMGAGEELQLLIYSYNPQFPITSSRTPFVPAVKVTGTVNLPILGDLPRIK